MSMPDKLLLAKSQAYSMESMAAHEAEDRETEYIGSLLYGNRIYDFYEDSEGEFWYKNRFCLPDGTTVSEEEWIFHTGSKKKRA